MIVERLTALWLVFRRKLRAYSMPLVTVTMMTNHLPCGREVQVEYDESTPVIEVKRRLEIATGIPVKDQKLMLANLGQPMLGDKRVAMSYGSTGRMNKGMTLAVPGCPSICN